MPELPPSTTPTAAQMNIALLLIRIPSALAFLYHGSAILFGAFGGPGPHGFAAYMHAPDIVGYLVGLAQFAGGIAILTGVLIRVGAACVIIIMLGAIFPCSSCSTASTSAPAAPNTLITQLLIAIALLITGAGAYSLTGMLPPALRKL